MFTMKKLCFAVPAAIALILASAAALAENAGFEAATEIAAAPYEEKTVLSADTQYWKYTPADSGACYFGLTCENANDYLYLYDASGNVLAQVYNGDTGASCGFSFDLEAGAVYYIGVRALNKFSAGANVVLSVSFGFGWSFEGGTLTVSCSGRMPDYSSETDVPWYGVRESVTRVITNANMTSVGSHAFSGFSALTEISLPAGTVRIGEGAFSGCSTLTGITLPENITSLENNVFSHCAALESVVIPAKVTSVGSYAFAYCTSLKSVAFPEKLESIGTGAFDGCSSLASVSVPEGVKSLPTYVFADCRALAEVSFPSTLTSVDRGAFCGCESLGRAVFAADPEKISFGALNECLMRLVPHGHHLSPEGVCWACGLTFSAEGMDTLVLPDDLTGIGAGAFSGVSAEAIVFPAGFASVPAGAFTNCENLRRVWLDEGASVPDGAFARANTTRIEFIYRAK